MFTGLIEEVGRLASLEKREESFLLSVHASKIASSSRIGDSVAVNGCCLTIVGISGSRVDFHLLQETLRCTNLGEIRPGSPVNCELPLAANGRLGGHFVQGHVDSTAHVVSANFPTQDFRIEIEIPRGFVHYLIPKGSIAINGVSLTVAELQERSFAVWIIPHTLEFTNLGNLQPGNPVNLEFDLLAKYVERMAAFPGREKS